MVSIGQLLRQRRVAKHLTAEDVGKVAGVSGMTYGRWENGTEGQGGCVDVSKAGVLLGLTPNQLFLKRQPLRGEERLSEIDRAALNALLTELVKMKSLLRSDAHGPIQMMAEFAAKWNEKWAELEPIPEGTVTAKPEPGVKTYQAPPPRGSEAMRKKLFGSAGEAKAKYGKRKRKD